MLSSKFKVSQLCTTFGGYEEYLLAYVFKTALPTKKKMVAVANKFKPFTAHDNLKWTHVRTCNLFYEFAL